MKTFKIVVFTALVAIIMSVLAQASGLSQIANSAVGRTFVAAPVSLAFVFLYNMKTALPLPGGTKQSIHTKADIILACIAGILAAVAASVFLLTGVK